MEGVVLDLLDPVLLEFDNRLIQKAKFRGELFPTNSRDKQARRDFLRHFQKDKQTQLPKGIIAIDLRELNDD